jgi:hypothetical protein
MHLDGRLPLLVGVLDAGLETWSTGCSRAVYPLYAIHTCCILIVLTIVSDISSLKRESVRRRYLRNVTCGNESTNHSIL